MRSYQLMTWMSRTEKGYKVTLYTQPWYRMAWAAIYHWYDMKIMHVPGIKTIARIVDWFRDKIYRDKADVPWLAAQDIRCWFLHEKGRRELVTFDITEEQHQTLRGKVTSQ